MVLTAFHKRHTPGQQPAATMGAIPMGHAGTSEECAGAYPFPAPDMPGSGMTGQVNRGQRLP